MKQIRIISGIYGHKPAGAKCISPVRAGERVTVSDEEAARLMRLGIAADDDAPVCDAPDNAPDTPAYDVSMSAGELRALLTQHGLPAKPGMTKADMVAALDAALADGQPPILSAAEPVL